MYSPSKYLTGPHSLSLHWLSFVWNPLPGADSKSRHFAEEQAGPDDKLHNVSARVQGAGRVSGVSKLKPLHPNHSNIMSDLVWMKQVQQLTPQHLVFGVPSQHAPPPAKVQLARKKKVLA